MQYPERLSFLAARRGLVPRLAGTAYVAAAALRDEDGRGSRPWLLALSALGLSALSVRSEQGPSSLALWGASLTLASLGASAGAPWIDVLGMLGAFGACLAALSAVARMSALAVGAVRPRRDRSPVVVGICTTLGWAGALSAAGCRALDVPSPWSEHAPTISIVAASLSLVGLAACCSATLRDRALVLGVADRAGVARAAAMAGAVVFGAGSLVLGEPDRVLGLGVAATSCLVAFIALHGDVVWVVRAWRRAAVLAVGAASIALLGAMAVSGSVGSLGGVVVVVTVAAVALGSVAVYLEQPLRPAEGTLLDAIERARAELARSEADDALRETLGALRIPIRPDAVANASGPLPASPELWTLEPTRVLTIDAAGYPRQRRAELPDAILTVVAAEPETTLRSDVLRALEVRRPELRAIARWMGDRDALTATIIAADGEPKGLLVLPRGRRLAPVTLEEARAIKGLAGGLVGICEAKSALARSLTREQQATARAEDAEDRVLRLERAQSLDVGRHVLAASRVARPATVGIYSAASRMAFEALERRTKVQAPIAVIAPSGVDTVPYLARAHLGGPRGTSPLVVVDGTSSREHDPRRWTDPSTSPLALADRGMLVLLDGAALPIDVQRLVALALAERRPPWARPEPLDIELALTGTQPPARLLDEGRLDAGLATRLGDALEAPIAFPRLSERPEDLRAILIDRLAREGLRTRGAPVGLEDAAFVRLAELPFSGEDAELASIVQRLVSSVAGDVVRVRDVEALGLGGSAPVGAPEVGAMAARRPRPL